MEADPNNNPEITTPESVSEPSDAPEESSLASHSSGETTSEASTEKGGKKKKSKGLGTSRGIETMFRTSYRVHMNLSALADTKANIMISINGIIISIIIASISPKIDTNPWLLVPTSVMLLACLGSIIFAVLSARPRVSSSVVTLEDVRNNRANILFFGHFVGLSEADYVTGMTELLNNSSSLYYNMIRDIYGLGNVLQRKFQLLRMSYTIFMIGLVVGISLFIGVYVWIVVTMGA